MNWYKKAFPISENPSYNEWGYMGIGHTNEPENNILWFIDNNFNLHTISETELAKETRTKTKNTHDYWGKFQSYNRRNTIYAKGRYDVNQNKASLSLAKNTIYGEAVNFADASKRLDFAVNKIEKILDRAFNNPIIQEF